MPDYKDYHKILELKEDATLDDVKRAYRAMAKKYHPDINKAPDSHERFIEITEAYEILMNRDLHEYYFSRGEMGDQEFKRAQYERAREAAREAARRYARMKFEKFKQEQEAFKKSGWHDLILILRYFIRILVFPLIVILITLPLISEEVSEHPTGYIIFWIIALMLMFFVINNWKNYFRIDSFYYHFNDLGKLRDGFFEYSGQECNYCPGQKAMALSYKVSIFRIKNIQVQNFGALYGRKAGINRDYKIIRIPRSRKAFIFHSLASLIKISVLLLCLIYLPQIPISRLSLPIGLVLGGLLSGLFLAISGTKPKSSYLLSYGMLIKFMVWTLLIWFLESYAFIFLFFDPMLEALLRFLSNERLFIPLVKQYPQLDHLFRNQYQLYMELPVLSVMNPLLKWLL
jgi:hypothetical protein